MSFSPHAFSLRQLQYALAVAEELSFRRAATRCHVSQPSLSAQLAQLEGALGVQLFERDRRRVLLTATAPALLERMRRALLEADDLVEATHRVRDPLAGTLRVGVIPTISPYLLPSLAPPLRAKFPQLALNWVEDHTAALVKSLDAGALDAALLALEADIGDLEHAVIATDPFVLVAPPGHPLARGPARARTSELRGARVLLLDDGHCFREQALEVCSLAKARELEFRATSLSTLVQMVAGGAGVTLLPRLCLPVELARADLRVRAFAEPSPHRTIALVWRKRSALDAALRQLGALMRSAYPSRRHAAPPSPHVPARARARARARVAGRSA
jgi:LysR family hydrogen peroxide-inducible transcriptional activator